MMACRIQEKSSGWPAKFAGELDDDCRRVAHDYTSESEGTLLTGRASIASLFTRPMSCDTQTLTPTVLAKALGRRESERASGGRKKMKVRASVKRMCAFCRVVKRRGIVFIHCTAKPKHKQRQGFSTIAEAAASCLHLPPPPQLPASGSASAAAFADASKAARQEMSMKFNWPLGLAALLKNGEK